MEVPPPGNFSDYPRFSRPPAVRFEALSKAIDLLRANLSVWVVVGLIDLILMVGLMAVLLGFPYYLLLSDPMASGGTGSAGPRTFLGLGLLIPAMVLYYGLYYALFSGMYRMALKQLDGQSISVGDMFAFDGKFLRVLGVALFTGMLVAIGLLLCILPGFLAAGLLLFASPLVIDRNMGVFAAVKESVRVLRGELWMAGVFALVLGIIASIGTYACYIGAIFTLPLYPLAIAVLYREYYPKAGAEVSVSSPIVPPPVVG